MPRVQRISLIYFLTLLFLSSLATKGTPALSQSQRPFSNRALQQSGQYRDTLRALIVFATFKDDNYAGDPAVNHREWPLLSNRAILPPSAHALLSENYQPPFPDSSLTAYFYEQSLGNFILYGHPYDSVLVSSYSESRYHRPEGGYADLTLELLNKIDSYGFDFSKYDHNRDGYIDYVFVILRGDSKHDSKVFGWTGASCLDGRCTGTILLDGGTKEKPVLDGKVLDWNRSGSYIMHRTPGNVSPFHYYIRLMAHEIGHDLWAKHFVHIPENRSNDVPRAHNRGRFRDCVGYVLMAGAGGAWDCGGSETISAFERELLGWIQCFPLNESKNNLLLRDLYTSSECYTVDLSERNSKLYISNLQQKGYFDQQRNAGKNGQFEIGLRTSGLLVHLVKGRGVDVLPADNDLALSAKHKPYEGDLFNEESSIQLTPWTQPNSNGYTHYPENFRPDWFAIDNIETIDSTQTIEFDFISDFRQQPIIREDSWIGDETEGYIFDQTIQVSNWSMLEINTTLHIKHKLLIEGGSTVRLGPESRLTFEPGSTFELKNGAQLIIEGTLVMKGLFLKSPRAKITLRDQGRIVSTLN